MVEYILLATAVSNILEGRDGTGEREGKSTEGKGVSMHKSLESKPSKEKRIKCSMAGA